jgi:hypothetical protein
MASFKKVEINLDYLTPNRSFIYPLWSENGDKVLEERVVLTSEKIREIRQKHGNMLHYRDSGRGSTIGHAKYSTRFPEPRSSARPRFAKPKR